jgi:hypothetical protein
MSDQSKQKLPRSTTDRRPLVPELQRIRDEVRPEEYARASAGKWVEMHRRRRKGCAIT